MSESVIRVSNLGKRYRIGEKQEELGNIREAILSAAKAPFRNFRRLRKLTNFKDANPEKSNNIIWALKDVSFEVKEGEIVGIIGRNGAGKSTLLKILTRITEPTEGYAEIRGRVSSLLEVGTGFHQELTGRENVYLNGSILGMRKWEIDKKFDEIVAFAEVEKFIDTPVKRYSSGMKVRLAFAVAAHLEPEVLLVDEVLAVGDIAFQKKCLGKMDEVAKKGRTVLFVSHNMPAILNLCSKGILLDAGKIRVNGHIQHIVNTYLNDSISLDGEVLFPEGRLRPNSELRFTAVRILDANKRSTAYVDLAKGFSLEIEYEVLQLIHSTQVAFELWNSTGVCILCSSDLDIEPESLRNTRYPGRYRLRCFIPPTYLRPGRYWIDLGSSIPAVRTLDEVRNAIAFEVIDTGSIEFKLSQGRRGIIAPILHWNSKRMTSN